MFDIKRKVVSMGLVLAMAVMCVGCSVSQFEAYLNAIAPAVLDVLQIISVFNGKAVNTALPAKIDADVKGIETLYADYEKADATGKTGLQNEINAAFTVLNSDLSVVFQMAQISDPKVQSKIIVLVGLIQSGVMLAEALVNPPTTVSANPTKLSPGELVASFNATLKTKTGNAKVDAATAKMHNLHVHGGLVRALTLGAVN